MNYGQNSSANSAAQKTVQQQLEAADVNTTNQAQRIQQYNTLEQQLVNDVAWIPEFQQEAQGLRKPCVVGVQDSANAHMYPTAWSSVYISTNTNCANATVR
jgi:ABC-type oligopeptide transport system substrate-binding subunit